MRRELKLGVEALAKIIAAGIYWQLQEDCETFKDCPQVMRRVIGLGKRGAAWRTSQWTGSDWSNAWSNQPRADGEWRCRRIMTSAAWLRGVHRDHDRRTQRDPFLRSFLEAPG